MKRKAMAGIIRKRCEKIEMAFRSVVSCAGQTEEMEMQAIHAFRLEVKKLRALLQMAGMAKHRAAHGGGHGSGGIKIPKKIHHYYGILGRVRNLLLQKQRIRKALLPGPEEPIPGKEAQAPGGKYLRLLAKEASGYKILARDLEKEQPGFKKQEKRLIARLLANPGKTRVKKFALCQIQRIRSLVDGILRQGGSGEPDDSGDGRRELHEIRKILKGLLYTWTFTGPYVVKELGSDPACSYADIESLASRLGEIQDRRISIDLLQPMYTDLVSHEQERVFLLDLRRDWLKEREDRERELVTQLREKFLSGKFSPEKVRPGNVAPEMGFPDNNHAGG